MEGIVLDKRKFLWLNDNDALFVFEKEITEKFKSLTPEQQILYGLDGYVTELNEQLFEQYQHMLVSVDDKLYGFDGLSYHLIEAGNMNDAYESALEIP